ncbi:TPA: hypothetical protein OT989_000054 [Klebsiella pneumoniae]|uniref:hypothetical protein n=1 Tax=Klebsiella pneumoniae TaxID=573 RepID=UPI00164AA527|nr:hypothetical protein [Klebsiella pneumoniae]EKY0545153.1 hypothetical protein [Klebsiella pneumoniae]MBC4618789.1 hypothetical protein [Klebsiella pneumoniae]MBO8077292.1 hypothetical protein [Klebsiella pneumoniae]MDG0284591.1 hypothetical protein [Klebsiella pneumoniae]HBR1819151.1 hypothetical protein [Klebsiella pneumoniae]
MQIKDIDKIAVLKRIAEIEASGRRGTLFPGFDNSINTSMPEGTPEKLQYAVMRNLIQKGLADGCCCGCRGDFVLTEKGVEMVSATTKS